MVRIQPQAEPAPEMEEAVIAANDNPEGALSMPSLPEVANDNEPMLAQPVLPEAANDNEAEVAIDDAVALANVKERLGMVSDKKEMAAAIQEIPQASPEGIEEVTERAVEAAPVQANNEAIPVPGAGAAQAAGANPTGGEGGGRRGRLDVGPAGGGGRVNRGGILGKLFKGIGKAFKWAGIAVIWIFGALYSLGMNATIKLSNEALTHAKFKEEGGGKK